MLLFRQSNSMAKHSNFLARSREISWCPSLPCTHVDHFSSSQLQDSDKCFDPSWFQHSTERSKCYFPYIMHSFFISLWTRDDVMLTASVATVRLKSDCLWEERLQDQVHYSQMIPKCFHQVSYCKLLCLLCSYRPSAKPPLNYRFEENSSYNLYIELMTHHNSTIVHKLF